MESLDFLVLQDSAEDLSFVLNVENFEFEFNFAKTPEISVGSESLSEAFDFSIENSDQF